MSQAQDLDRLSEEFVPGEGALAAYRKAYNSKSPWGKGYGRVAYVSNLMSGAHLGKVLAREALHTAVSLPLPALARRMCRRLSEDEKVKASAVERGQHVMTISISSRREQLLLRAAMMRFKTARMEKLVWRRVVDLLLSDLYQQLECKDIYLDAGKAKLRQGVLQITVLVEDCQ